MNKPVRDGVDIFDHVDYVTWLRALFERRDMRFNYSTVARRVGINSRGYWHNMVRGDRPMSDEIVRRLSEYLGLDESEGAYFQALVSIQQAQTDEARAAAELRAAGLRKVRLAARLDEQNAMYLSQWHTTAIREAWEAIGHRPNAAWIAERLCPPISVELAAEAIDCIERLGLAPGASASDLSTGHQAPTRVGVVWHEQMLGLAQRAVRQLGREERFVDGVAFSVSASKAEELKQRIARMVQEINAAAAVEPGPADAVMVLEVALFPIARPLGGTSLPSS